MPFTTTSVIAGPVNVIFQTNLLRRALAKCPYFYGSMAAEISSHNNSFTARWRRYENVTPTTTPLVELGGAVTFPTRTGSSPSVTNVDATVQKYGDFFFLNEEVDLINLGKQGSELSNGLGIQAGRSLNRLQRDILEDNFTQVFAGTATTATGISATPTTSGFIKGSDVDTVTNALDRNDAMKFMPMTKGDEAIGTTPLRQTYFGIAHPDIAAGLRVLTGFNSVQTYAGQTETMMGEVGEFRGVRFVETSEATIDLTTGVAATGSATTHGRSTATRFDVYSVPIYGQDAVGSLGLDSTHVKTIYEAGDKLPGILMIAHAKGSAGAGDPLNEVASVGWKSWHAGTVLNSTWGRTLKAPAPILDPNE